MIKNRRSLILSFAAVFVCVCVEAHAQAVQREFETKAEAMKKLVSFGCAIGVPLKDLAYVLKAPVYPVGPGATSLNTPWTINNSAATIGPNLSRLCLDPDQRLGGSALGGGMSSLQSTRTVSQFDLNRRRNEPCEASENGDCETKPVNPADPVDIASNYSSDDQNSLESRFGSFNLNVDDGLMSGSGIVPMGSFNIFTQFEYSDIRQTATKYEPGFDGRSYTAELGSFWNISENSVLGFKGTYLSEKGRSPGTENFQIEVFNNAIGQPYFGNFNFEDECGVPSDGKADSDEFGGSVFYQGRLLESGFFNAEVGVSKKRVNYSYSSCYMLLRNIGSTAGPGRQLAGIISGSPDIFETFIDLKAGYDWRFGGFSIGPRLGLNSSWQNIDGYSETETTGTKWYATGTGLTYEDQDISSVQTRVGFAVSVPFVTDRLVLTPYAQLDYVHEFANDQRAIKVSFVEDNRPDPFMFSFLTNEPDRDYFELRGGFAAEFFEGGAAYVDGRTILGNDLVENYGITAGVRISF